MAARQSSEQNDRHMSDSDTESVLFALDFVLSVALAGGARTNREEKKTLNA